MLKFPIVHFIHLIYVEAFSYFILSNEEVMFNRNAVRNYDLFNEISSNPLCARTASQYKS